MPGVVIRLRGGAASPAPGLHYLQFMYHLAVLSPDPALLAAVDTVPPGAWAVGVSGGADSVALLLLLRGRADLRLTLLHVNHEARGAASDADEHFVTALACRLGVDFVAGHWHGIEPMLNNPPANRSARFRAGRLAFFRHVVKPDRLQG